jgi:hypothetical protein
VLRNAYTILVRKPEGKLRGLDVNWRIMFTGSVRKRCENKDWIY